MKSGKDSGFSTEALPSCTCNACATHMGGHEKWAQSIVRSLFGKSPVSASLFSERDLTTC